MVTLIFRGKGKLKGLVKAKLNKSLKAEITGEPRKPNTR